MSNATKIPVAIQELKTKIRCGTCSGLSRDKLVNNATCDQQGILATSRTCNSYKPDSFDLAEDVRESGGLLALAHLMSKLPPKKLDLLAALIQNDKKTRRQKMVFGQRVYVRYRGLANANYMSNFMQAFILDADKDFIRVMSRDGSCTLTYQNDGNNLTGPALYSKSEFDKIRSQMVDDEMYIDPEEERNTIKRLRAIEEYQMSMTSESENGDITTIDTVFEENDLPRGKSTLNDLSAIVRDIESGFDIRKTRGTGYRNRKSTRKPSRKVSDQNLEV